MVEFIPLAEEKDAITPTLIEHRVDSGAHERTGEVLYHYNYLYYRFDADGEIWARSYLDEIDKVSLFLPQGMDLESSLTLDPTYAERPYAHRDPDARAVAHHGGGQARQVAGGGGPERKAG